MSHVTVVAATSSQQTHGEAGIKHRALASEEKSIASHLNLISGAIKIVTTTNVFQMVVSRPQLDFTNTKVETMEALTMTTKTKKNDMTTKAPRVVVSHQRFSSAYKSPVITTTTNEAQQTATSVRRRSQASVEVDPVE